MTHYLWGKGPSIKSDVKSRPYTIAYIHGAGHCGSTLLNLMLNAHPQAIGLSELENVHNTFMDRADVPEIKKLRESDFWQTTLSDFEHRFGSPLLCNNNRIKLSDWSGYFGLKSQALTHIQNVNRALFDSIAARSGATVICDASKFLLRLHMLIDAGLPVKVIHLHRDGRGVMHSYLRKGYSVENSFHRWSNAEVGYLLLSHWLPKTDAHYCCYENLATQPERELKRICSFLRLKYEPEMLTDFNKETHFGIGGNRMLSSKNLSIRMDVEWKRQLDFKSKNFFWLKGGWIQWPVRFWATLKSVFAESYQQTFLDGK